VRGPGAFAGEDRASSHDQRGAYEQQGPERLVEHE
jgi:hypothetical protein